MKELEETVESSADGSVQQTPEATRKPYEAPVLTSGDVFERIVLASAPLEAEFVC